MSASGSAPSRSVPSTSSTRIRVVAGTPHDAEEMPGSFAESGEQSEAEVGVSRPCRRGPKKKNFTERETELIVDEATRQFALLAGKKYKETPVYQRNAIWKNITDSVNAFGHETRTIDQVKKKWSDLRRIVKAKLSKISRQQSNPGCESDENVRFSRIEEKVAATYTRGQVEGVGNMDVMAMADDEEDAQRQEAAVIAMEGQASNIESPENPAASEEQPVPNVAPIQETVEEHLGLSRVQMEFFQSFVNETKTTMKGYGQSLSCIQESLKTIANIMLLEYGSRHPSSMQATLANITNDASLPTLTSHAPSGSSNSHTSNQHSSAADASLPLFSSNLSESGSSTPELSLTNDSVVED